MDRMPPPQSWNKKITIMTTKKIQKLKIHLMKTLTMHIQFKNNKGHLLGNNIKKDLRTMCRPKANSINTHIHRISIVIRSSLRIHSTNRSKLCRWSMDKTKSRIYLDSTEPFRSIGLSHQKSMTWIVLSRIKSYKKSSYMDKHMTCSRIRSSAWVWRSTRIN